tara:strand:+ start:2197 stop:2361 length:165 start_codon:yes stop_codon:yes gene_type:complete
MQNVSPDSVSKEILNSYNGLAFLRIHLKKQNLSIMKTDRFNSIKYNKIALQIPI